MFALVPFSNKGTVETVRAQVQSKQEEVAQPCEVVRPSLGGLFQYLAALSVKISPTSNPNLLSFSLNRSLLTCR